MPDSIGTWVTRVVGPGKYRDEFQPGPGAWAWCVEVERRRDLLCGLAGRVRAALPPAAGGAPVSVAATD